MVFDEVITNLMYQPRFHVGSYTSDFQASLKPVIASCRVATLLDWWLAFSTKFPQDYICSQTNRSKSSIKSNCDRQSLEKYKESSHILSRVSHDSTPKESTSGVEVAVNNIENLTQNSQSHNVQNFLSHAEFKDCQNNINSTKK